MISRLERDVSTVQVVRVGSVFRYAFAEFPKIQLNIILYENSPQTLIGGCRQRYP